MSTLRHSFPLVAIAVLLAAASPMHAQSCRGLPDMTRARLNLGSVASATGGARAVAGIAGFAASHVFGELRLGGEGPDYFNLLRRAGTGVLGVSAPVASNQGTACLLVSYGHIGDIRNMPNPSSTANASLGLALGRAYSMGRATLTPFVQAEVIRSDMTYRPVYLQFQESDGWIEPIVGDRRHAISWLGQLVVGTGFRLYDRFTVAPSMGVPLERTGNQFGRDFTFGITGTMTLPR